MKNEKYMMLAIKEAKKSLKSNDVPVGAIVVCNNKIIAKGYNKKEKTKMVTQHAEIIAINKACRKLKTWHLDECVLYITMEPCMMCCGAIIQSRIKRIVYGIENEKFGFVKKSPQKLEIEGGICKSFCLELIQNFFASKRK